MIFLCRYKKVYLTHVCYQVGLKKVINEEFIFLVQFHGQTVIQVTKRILYLLVLYPIRLFLQLNIGFVPSPKIYKVRVSGFLRTL